MIPTAASAAPARLAGAAALIGRIERMPVSRLLLLTRLVVGSATFFDGYTTICIAYALPLLRTQWQLHPTDIGWIIAAGYLGQLVGAVLFGWAAERVGRLPVLTGTVVLYTAMNLACGFATGGAMLAALRFIQGIGTGGEVPVASAYVNEFIGARRRGAFFLLYEVIFAVGLMFAGLCGYFLVPLFGWRVMFWIGTAPALLLFPLRLLLPESPRWLLARGRVAEAEAVVARMERDVTRRGGVLPQATPVRLDAREVADSNWRDLFRGIYLRRTLMLWALWFCSYVINNALVTWLPTLYMSVFHLKLSTSLGFGWIMSVVGVLACVACALLIDRVGRRRWYIWAFALAAVPHAILAITGASSALHVLIFAATTYAILQTVTFSLYLYTAELYPTRLRAIGSGFGSAWLRLGSSVGPLAVGVIMTHFAIGDVFLLFALVAAFGALICARFATETRARVLEELSP